MGFLISLELANTSDSSVQFNSVTQLCLTLCDPMDCRTPDLPVHHQLPEFIQTHVHWVSDAIQPSHSLSSPSPLALNLHLPKMALLSCKVASAVSNSVRPHRWQPTRLPRPWDSPGKKTGVGCHFLLQCMKVKNESEVAQSCPTLCDPMDCSAPGYPVLHYLLEFAQIHLHWIGDVI